jgi:hypothetical protein
MEKQQCQAKNNKRNNNIEQGTTKGVVRGGTLSSKE